MKKSSFKALKKQAEDIYQRYDGHFAGKPRATRNLDLLAELIAELEELVEEAKSTLNGSRDPAMLSLLDMAKQNLDVYKGERREIIAAQAKGPTSVAASQVIMEANLAFGRYHRHYAGKDRRTRDLGLLTEIIVELEGVEETMKKILRDEGEGLEENIEIVGGNLTMYRSEYRAIDQAQQSGDAQEQADTLATLANEQFKLYRQHFAGKSRHIRRPGLLERMISQLGRIQKQMRSLQRGGLDSQSNGRNMKIVKENLDVYQREIEEIRKARSSLSTEQLAGSLGGAANEIMGEYRSEFAGQDRRTRSLERLSLLCDEIGEIAYQMRSIERDDPSPMNAKNLNIVLDAWTMYESEYRRVEEAQSS